MRVIKQGIDTLRLGIFFEWDAVVFSEIQEKLQSARVDYGKTPQVMHLGKARIQHEVRPLPRSKTGAPYTVALVAEDWTIEVSTWVLKEGANAPNLMVTFRARPLAVYGWQGCVAAFQSLMGECGRVGKVQVSRVDVHVDVEGWSLGPGVLGHVTSRCSPGSREEHWYAVPEDAAARGSARVCSYELGSRGRRGIALRLYRKDVQSAQVSDAAWVRGVWRLAGWNGFTPVTRAEFEIGRERIVEFGIDTLEKLERNLRNALVYLTNEWVRLTGPHSEAWGFVSGAFAGVEAAARKPVEVGDAAPEQLAAQAAGCLVTLLARAPSLTVEAALAEVVKRAFWSAQGRKLEAKPRAGQLSQLREVAQKLTAASERASKAPFNAAVKDDEDPPF